MINLTASLQTGVAAAGTGKPRAVHARGGRHVSGGHLEHARFDDLRGHRGCHFDSFEPTQSQLGLQSIDAVAVNRSKLSYKFSAGTPAALTQNGAYATVQTAPPIPTQPGAALGSIDQSLALVAGASNGTNLIRTSFGSLTLDYPDLLTALSEAYRPDLTSSALIDIQGDVQSIRGASATGMVLNDNGNLNLVKFASVSNSTIIGQPLSHLQIINRSHVMILTPSRTAGGRNGVLVDKGLQPIGPLSQTND